MSNKVMLNDYWTEKLVLLNDFECRLFTFGILLNCDFWGVMENSIYQLSRSVHKDAVIDMAKIQPALNSMVNTGLITFLGESNSLIVVEDWGDYQHYQMMRLNFSQHNKRPKYEREIILGIRTGELAPYFLELPAVAPKDKTKFKQNYKLKTLSDKVAGQLLYPELYVSTSTGNNHSKQEVIVSGEPKPIPVPISDRLSHNNLSINKIERTNDDEL